MHAGVAVRTRDKVQGCLFLAHACRDNAWNVVAVARRVSHGVNLHTSTDRMVHLIELPPLRVCSATCMIFQ